ncbi:Hexaprenyldihydroxybenzoate methyltransferase, mitochondrial-like protein [Gossypium australe]|uniref:Hexaprenyldihydroxybenzoate methyltransferase, mitochondrial-like protein n=1 Tax=Gossypium australe TaxID=47621 RepID=A0A5B6UZR9_9ROSI|nr:Hexaprenyldihydroxybenzoate methyltransferase, mitochondrial-like protein [Gossypium australe]
MTSPPFIPPVIPLVAPPPPPMTEPSQHCDPVKAEYWLQNIFQFFEEMACPPDDFLGCVVSLLKERAYSWWTTLVAVIPREKISWDFFYIEFKNKYVRKRYLDMKKREFLELR